MEEEKRLDEFTKDLIHKLEEISPLHFKYRNPHVHPLAVYFSPAPMHVRIFNQSYRDINLCYWACILYKDFEEEGFSHAFAKRVIEKYIDLGKIKRKKRIPGFIYGVTDFEKLSETIKYSRKIVDLDHPNCLHLLGCEWLFDKYSDLELSKLFDKYKNLIFNSMHNNLVLDDSVLNEK